MKFGVDGLKRLTFGYVDKFLYFFGKMVVSRWSKAGVLKCRYKVWGSNIMRLKSEDLRILGCEGEELVLMVWKF